MGTLKPEQDLICSLLNILRVVPPRTIPHPFIKDARPGTPPQWQAGQVVPFGDKRWNEYAIEQLESAARRGGSDNHIKLRLGCGVATAETGADAAAVAWLAENRLMRGWDGYEPGCRNDYGLPMHRASDLVFLRFGSPALRDLAGQSMDLFRFWAWTGAPITGQRSAVGGREQRGLIDEAADFVAGRGPFPAALPATWDRMLIAALAPELRAVATRPLANPKCAMATPTLLFVGDDAAMAVQSKEVDTNTDAVLVCREEKDGSRKRTWGPTPPWGRLREQASEGQVSILAGKAHYTSVKLGSVDVPLPAKNLKVYQLGSGSVEPDGAVVAMPQPPPAPGPQPPVQHVMPLAPARHSGCLVPVALGTLALGIPLVARAAVPLSAEAVMGIGFAAFAVGLSALFVFARLMRR